MPVVLNRLSAVDCWTNYWLRRADSAAALCLVTAMEAVPSVVRPIEGFPEDFTELLKLIKDDCIKIAERIWQLVQRNNPFKAEESTNKASMKTE